MITDVGNKKAQDIQDEIFRKMSADQKLGLAAGLWRLGQEMNKKIIHGEHRSAEIIGRDNVNSR
jgi:hypothetical protein